ncbi:MAG: response regulator [Bacteroidia bacterium]
MQRQLTFIIIDDNVIDILIYKLLLKGIFANARIIYFMEAQAGLAFIKENYPLTSLTETILLLDLNMPGMNGWEFLKEFEQLKEDLRRQIRICIVSFYANEENEKLALLSPNVDLLISKPLSKEKVLEIFNACTIQGSGL